MICSSLNLLFFTALLPFTTLHRSGKFQLNVAQFIGQGQQDVREALIVLQGVHQPIPLLMEDSRKSGLGDGGEISHRSYGAFNSGNGRKQLGGSRS
jgi:hypothetical protein